VHTFWSHLDQFFLGLQMLQTKVVEKIKIRVGVLCSVTFFLNLCLFFQICALFSKFVPFFKFVPF